MYLYSLQIKGDSQKKKILLDGESIPGPSAARRIGLIKRKFNYLIGTFRLEVRLNNIRYHIREDKIALNCRCKSLKC
jgi:hypothetical protein